MDNKIKQLLKFQDSLSDLQEACYELLNRWQECDIEINDLPSTDLYPFHRSFDEIIIDIETWAAAVDKDIADETKKYSEW